MLGRASKTFFHLVAQSGTLRKLASRYGMRKPSSFARRFIAGETIEEAVEAAHAIEAQGLHLTLKSGNFGTTDFFTKAFGALQRA